MADCYSGDIGLLYLYDKNLTLGASILNLGTPIEYLEKKYHLPLVIRTGVSYYYKKRLIISTDLLTIVNAIKGQLRFNLGVEYMYKRFMIFRVGYKINYETENFTFGLGIPFGYDKNKRPRNRMDFSFQNIGELGIFYRSGVLFSFR